MKILQMNRVVKKFGALIAVNGVSIDLEKGESLGIAGPNGSGKTTLLNLISGFLKSDSGEIVFNGKKITKFTPHKIVSLGMARTFQIPQNSHELTVYDNIKLACLIKSIEVDDFEKKIKEMLQFGGLYQMRNEFSGNLPLGHLRRLELVKALCTNPDLILLDEIFSGLSHKEITEVMALLKDAVKNGVSLIIVEHLLKVLNKIINRLVILDMGLKIAEGSPEKVVNNDQVVEAYLGSMSYA